MNLPKHLVILVASLMLVIPAVAIGQTAEDKSARSGRFDVREYGVRGDGSTLDTLTIETAIRAANMAGGGTVVFPPGTY